MDESAILSIEKYERETIVFFEKKGALSVAGITKSNKGYSWFRSTQYYDFKVGGDIPYTTGGFNFETETGLTASIIYRKIFDVATKKMKLSGDGVERELEVLEDSKLFYAIHQKPFSNLDVDPIKE